ncbi:MAG TPA: DUF2178 domain-containing protein [Xanthomonadaceae bacterium]|nr:DUF2178 domain-containing protein [Xanthomonadaceae bacterium]
MTYCRVEMTMVLFQRSALWVLPPLLGGLALMLFGPARVLGLSNLLVGGLLVVVSGWAGLHLRVRGSADENAGLAHAEAQAWLGALFANLIYLVFLAQLRTLGEAANLAQDPAVHMAAMILGMFAAIWLLLTWRLHARYADPVVEDERDRAIARKTAAFGDSALMICVAMTALVLAVVPTSESAWATPPRVALMLFNLLLLRVALRWNAAVLLYWWDRR